MNNRSSERVEQARKFPQGIDWFWTALYSAIIGIQLANNDYFWAILTALIGGFILYASRESRILNARIKDDIEEIDRLFIETIKELAEKEKK